MSVVSTPQSNEESLSAILEEAWDRFHPAILWWAERTAAVSPENAQMVYRELMSGPRSALPLACRLHKAMQAVNAH